MSRVDGDGGPVQPVHGVSKAVRSTLFKLDAYFQFCFNTSLCSLLFQQYITHRIDEIEPLVQGVVDLSESWHHYRHLKHLNQGCTTKIADELAGTKGGCAWP
jgi:hypothetical protein